LRFEEKEPSSDIKLLDLFCKLKLKYNGPRISARPTMPLMDVEDLRMYYRVSSGWVRAVDGLAFKLDSGRGLGVVGESGCGKTSIAITLMKILPRNARIFGGRIIFNEEDLVPMSETDMRKNIRWSGISLIFQGAMNALNPVLKIDDQIVEAIKIHESNVTEKEAKERIAKLFELVGVNPSRASNYPHEFSGGMKQRACIAMALACNPKMLISDEPSTALDVIIAAQILKLMRELKEKLNLAMMVISHDLSIVTETCEEAAIVYAGKVAEFGDIVQIFKEPLHPYTQGLLSAFPSIKAQKTRLVSIPGSPPDLTNPPPGCRFNPRCKYAMEVCRKKVPALIETEKNHFAACHLVNPIN
jgi:peptide/nickel transport system ATP-binding protein